MIGPAIGPETIRILFALRATPPFDRLDDGELLLIAQHARVRVYPADRVLLAAGAVPEALFVRIVGGAVVGGRATPAVFDAPGLLFGLPAAADCVAGPEGLEAVVIAKPHVFTIARECPEFITGLADVAA